MRRVLTIMSLGVALAACADDPVAPSGEDLLQLQATTSRASQPCGSPQVEPLLDFDVGAAEGVAVSREGDVFVGNINTGEAWRAPHGEFGRTSLLVDLIEEDSPLSFLLGMDVDKNGILYAAVNALLDPSVHGLWRVEPDGTAIRAAEFPTFFVSLLNDVAIDPKGNVYVSDSFGGAIWRLTPDGTLDVWIESELLRGGVHPVFGIEFGVNGLAYYRGALYGGIHLNGRVIRLPIERDGTAGTPVIVVEDDALIGNDGIELDAKGNIYLANNFANTVQRVRATDLRIETVVAEGLSAPASLAISSNHKMLYVANLSTSAAQPQPHAPALVQAEFSLPIVSGQPPCASGN